MALTIFIKYCEFIENSTPNNLTLSDFIGKFPEVKKIDFLFFASGAILTTKIVA